jgi:hypothetical protein
MNAGVVITVLGVLTVILLCLFEDLKQQEVLARMEVTLDKE